MSGYKKSKGEKKEVGSHHVAGYPHGKSPGKGSAAGLTDARKHGNTNHGEGPAPVGPRTYHPEGT